MRAVLINTTDEIGHHGCTLVNRQIDHYARLVGIDFVERLSLNQNWNTVRDFDIALVNGEGSLHGSSKAAKRIAQVPDWAHSRQKKAILINSIYQNNDAAIDREIQKFDMIAVRDRYSQNRLRELGVDSTFMPDLTLTWDVNPAICGSNVVYNGSTRKQIRQRLFELAKKHNSTYLPILARPNQNKTRLYKFHFKQFLSYLAPKGLWRSRNQNAITQFEDFIAFLHGSTKGLVSGRFHMITIALCLEIPFLAVPSNTHKLEALLGELDLNDRLVDLDYLENRPDIIPAAFSENELKKIRIYRQEAKQLAETIFNKIKAL